MAKRYFLVSCDIPESLGVQYVRRMVEEDVGSWQGSMHPDDEIQDFDRDSVRAKTIPKTREAEALAIFKRKVK